MGIELLLLLLGAYLLSRPGTAASAPAPLPSTGLGLGGNAPAPGVPAPMPPLVATPGVPAPMPPLVTPPGGVSAGIPVPGVPAASANADAASVLGALMANPSALAALVRTITANPQLAAQLAAAAPQLAQLAAQLAANPQLAAMAAQVLAANPQASAQLLQLLASSPALLALARQALGAGAPGATTPGATTPGADPFAGLLGQGMGLLGQLLGGGAPGATTPGATTPGATTPGAPMTDQRLAAEQLATLAHAGSVRWGVHSATVEALQRRMGGVTADGWIGERTAARVAQLVGYPVWDSSGRLVALPGTAHTTGAGGGSVVAPHAQADTIAGLILSNPAQRVPLVLAAVSRHPLVLLRASQRAPRLAALGQRVAAGAPLVLDEAARGELVALLRDDAEFRAIAAQALGVT